MFDTLGKRIKMLREAQGITKAQLMKELNINNLGRFEWIEEAKNKSKKAKS